MSLDNAYDDVKKGEWIVDPTHADMAAHYDEMEALRHTQVEASDPAILQRGRAYASFEEMANHTGANIARAAKTCTVHVEESDSSDHEDFDKEHMEIDPEPTAAEIELDLEAFFDLFELPIVDRIKMCRSYATYLSARIKATGPPDPKKRKK